MGRRQDGVPFSNYLNTARFQISGKREEKVENRARKILFKNFNSFPKPEKTPRKLQNCGIFMTHLLSEVGVAGTVTGVEAADFLFTAAFNRPIFIRMGPMAVLRIEAASS